MENFQGEIRYQKLERKNNKITAENPLIDRYFRELNNRENSKVAHNGWIMNGNPLEDFGMTGWHYFRRTIVIWADSVKLRYGNSPSDSPFLWDHMSKYVYDMAMTFDGFRLDNAHSTPIHVAYYLLQVARSVNPNLFVMAELFTSSSELDSMFVRKLNINGLIREMQNCGDAS
jgi:glycogen debranching enzyme